jgi:hypothetical protein
MPQPTVTLTRLWGLAGLAAAVLPAAILVHLVAEALALGRAGVGLDFAIRHLYLGALFVAAVWAFAHTVGVGAGRAEIRRRTALLRARLTGRHDRAGLPLLVAANLAFFALTQAAEGVPILSGTLWLGLAAGILGSLVTALLVWAFGRALVVAAIAALAHAARRGSFAGTAGRRREPDRSRAAAAVFSLFAPNRPPPPGPSSDDPISLQKGTSCTHLFARRERRLRFSSALFFS